MTEDKTPWFSSRSPSYGRSLRIDEDAQEPDALEACKWALRLAAIESAHAHICDEARRQLANEPLRPRGFRDILADAAGSARRRIRRLLRLAQSCGGLMGHGDIDPELELHVSAARLAGAHDEDDLRDSLASQTDSIYHVYGEALEDADLPDDASREFAALQASLR